MSEHEQRPRDEEIEADETVEDLEVPEGQAQDVAGGQVKFTDIVISKK